MIAPHNRILILVSAFIGFVLIGHIIVWVAG